jgi:hypothetical protein
MPYGWTCSGPLFYKLMDEIFADKKWKSVVIYADDCLIYSKTFEDHIAEISDSLDRLTGFKLATKKCLFFRKTTEYLGFEISVDGITPGQRNINKIKDIKVATTKDIRQFLGMCGFYRRWVKDYVKIINPLQATTTKNYTFPDKKMTEEMEVAVKTLKDKLSSYPILCHPDFNRRFFLETDASKEGCGAVLFQKDDKNRRYVVGYASQTPTST